MKSLPEIRERVDLAPFNTLAIAAKARYFARVTDADQINAALAWANERKLPVLILGGGSNLVLRSDLDGLVLHIALAGRHWRDIGTDTATLVLGAGENWHDAVLYAANSGYRGIENLALSFHNVTRRHPAYDKYIWWFWQQQSINAGRDDARDKIEARFKRFGWLTK